MPLPAPSSAPKWRVAPGGDCTACWTRLFASLAAWCLVYLVVTSGDEAELFANRKMRHDERQGCGPNERGMDQPTGCAIMDNWCIAMYAECKLAYRSALSAKVAYVAVVVLLSLRQQALPSLEAAM